MLPSSSSSVLGGVFNLAAGRSTIVPPTSLGQGDTTMRTIWIVRWRGLDEKFPSAADAMDRKDQLEARGIEAEMFEIVARRRRRIA